MSLARIIRWLLFVALCLGAGFAVWWRLRPQPVQVTVATVEQGLVERLKNEAPRYAQLLPELPRLVHQALLRGRESDPATLALLVEQRRTNRLLQALGKVLADAGRANTADAWPSL